MPKTSNYLTDKNVRPEQVYLSPTPNCSEKDIKALVGTFGNCGACYEHFRSPHGNK